MAYNSHTSLETNKTHLKYQSISELAMETTWLLYSTLSLIFLLSLKFLVQTRNGRKHLPPSPLALPVIGHLHLLRGLLHRNLHHLSQEYGPIISLRFGSRPVVVVSSPSAVEECFTKNDIIFANRPRILAGKHLNYNQTSLVTAPYGDHWRNLRRLSALEIFSSNRLNMYSDIRKDEMKLLLLKLSRDSTQDFAKVELKSMLHELMFNIIMRMISGKRYIGEGKDFEKARQFREIMMEIFEYSGASHPGDFIPILRWIDYQGYEKKLTTLGRKADAFFQDLINEQRSNKQSDLESRKTMVDHLLSLQESEPDYYTDEIIKGLIMNLLLAGTDTSAITTEWAMSLLLNHPKELEKARVELDTHIGDGRLVDEPDVLKLTDLQNIISETLRLFPAAPLLVPHMASDDCILGGFDISHDTILLVNAWAIHRDPNVWDDSTSFKPERFENSGESRETHKLMPFGLGRRVCPGVGLANRMVGLALGSLIQCFEWEKVGDEDVDMKEGMGLTMPKVKPLEAMCKARQIINNVLFQTMDNFEQNY